MEEYIKKQQKRRKKAYIRNTILCILIVILMVLLYVAYIEIDVDPKPTQVQKPVEGIKLSQTIEEIKQEDKTITEVIEQTNESVVGISKLKNAGNTIFLENGTSQIGLGTGMIVSEDGYILTNEHVSGSKYSNCYVTTASGRTYQGNVVWSDNNIDLAIVKINVKNLPYVTLGDSDQVKVGQSVYAIGNPIGYEFQRTVTSGIISAVNRTIVLQEEEKSSYMEDLIQTDATINPGNSGGPLINAEGQVIGVTSVKITSAEGIGFAIPINIVKTIIQSFATVGKFEEAYLGIFAYDKNVIPYLDNNLKLNHGIYIAYISTNSPASKYGLKEKDILLEIDGISLSKMCDLRCYIYSRKPSEEVTLKLLRNGRSYETKVILGKK